MRILILGASGMLGSAALRVLSEKKEWTVFGSVRSGESKELFASHLAERLLLARDLESEELLESLFLQVQPDVVVNCVALRQGHATPVDPLKVMSVFAVLPQRLARLCRLQKARLIQIGSDGVFSGAKGRYTEEDPPDATDAYGIAKFLGEVREPHAVTIRTSIIGHELQTRSALLEWFLSRQGECRCFTRALFSGLPTVVLAGIIRDVIIPRTELSGVYHVAAGPISKFDLLTLVAEIYRKEITIIPDDQKAIDRTLVAAKFQRETGYCPPDWRQLIQTMHSYR